MKTSLFSNKQLPLWVNKKKFWNGVDQIQTSGYAETVVPP